MARPTLHAAMTLTPRLMLMMTLPPLLWAGNAVVGRIAIAHIAPLQLNALRWVLATALLVPLGWGALATPARRRAARERLLPLAVLGLVGVGSYNALQYLALKTSTPINVTLIASASPVWMMAVGALFFGVRPRRAQGAGAALSLLGVAVVLSRGHLESLAQVRFVAGDLLMTAAVVLWAVYSWLLARPPRSMREDRRPDWTWAEFLLLQTLAGTAWAGLAALVESGVGAGPSATQWTPLLWAALAYVAIGPSIVAYRCWGIGVAEAGPATAALFGNLTPLFAALLSAALLSEPPQAYHVLAFALTVAGIVVSSRPERKP